MTSWANLLKRPRPRRNGSIPARTDQVPSEPGEWPGPCFETRAGLGPGKRKGENCHDYHGTVFHERESTLGPANRFPATGGGGAGSGVVDLDDGSMRLVAGHSPASHLNGPANIHSDPAGRYSPAPPGFVERPRKVFGAFTAET